MTGPWAMLVVAAILVLAGHGIATLEPLADRVRVTLSLGSFALGVLLAFVWAAVVAVAGGA